MTTYYYNTAVCPEPVSDVENEILRKWELWAAGYFCDQLIAEGYQAGWNSALIANAAQTQALESKVKRLENAPALREVQIKLLNAVGQAMQVNSSLLSGIANTFDNGLRQ